MERAQRFRGKGEIGVFTAIIVNTHPPIGIKRSLIKTETGVGDGGLVRLYYSIAPGSPPNETMFLNELIVVFVPSLFLNLPWLTLNHNWGKWQVKRKRKWAVNENKY